MVVILLVLIAAFVIGANLAGLDPDSDPMPNWARAAGVGVMLLSVGAGCAII